MKHTERVARPFYHFMRSRLAVAGKPALSLPKGRRDYNVRQSQKYLAGLGYL